MDIQVIPCPNPIVKDTHMDKNTLKSSFGKWVAPINTKNLLEQVEESKQDYYTKKLTTEAYIKLMLLAQLQGFESLEAMSDALVDDGLQKALGFDSISKLDKPLLFSLYLF